MTTVSEKSQKAISPMVRKGRKDYDDLAKNCFIQEAKVYDELVNKLWQLKKE